MTSIDIHGDQVRAYGVTVRLSNTGKVLFPEDGITKGELIEYYGRVADWMLPYLRDRPIAMARFPDGITRQRIFQKNPAGYYPDWVTSVEVEKQGGTLRHVVCDKAATLLYLANQACIEFHVFLSRVDSLDYPDQVVVRLRSRRRGRLRRCPPLRALAAEPARIRARAPLLREDHRRQGPARAPAAEPPSGLRRGPRVRP